MDSVSATLLGGLCGFLGAGFSFYLIACFETYFEDTYQPTYTAQILYKRAENACGGKGRCSTKYIFTLVKGDKNFDKTVSYFDYRKFNEGQTVTYRTDWREIRDNELQSIVNFKK